jgi:hypothetical protein
MFVVTVVIIVCLNALALLLKHHELLRLRNKLESVSNESKEKDRVQANDFKLIMQLSKKLKNLLTENEDLRDQNDRLNTRRVTVKPEKMNSSGRG